MDARYLKIIEKRRRGSDVKALVAEVRRLQLRVNTLELEVEVVAGRSYHRQVMEAAKASDKANEG